MSSDRSFMSSRWMNKFHCIEYGERFSGFCGQADCRRALEAGARIGDRQIQRAAVGAEDLLNGERPELAQVLQLLHERGIVEDAKAGADDGLRTELVGDTRARSEVVVIALDQRPTEAEGAGRLVAPAGHR